MKKISYRGYRFPPASAPAAIRLPYRWALRMHGFENAGRAGGAIRQSKDK
jgi:hypothetical protein